MSKFNKKSHGTKTVNLAGGSAYKMSEKFELAALVLTSFVEDKYYESSKDTINRMVKLAEKTDPVFLGKLAVYARREAHMRSASHILLAELARLHKGQKDVLRAGFERPDDMCEVVAYYGNKYGKPLPNALKKAIRENLRELNAYQLGKYKGAGKDVKMIDLFNLVHPAPKDEAQGTMWGEFLKGTLKAPETWEVGVSAGKTEAERAGAFEKLIVENKMGYMALLKNLRNFSKYKLSNEVLQKVAETIQDPEKVAKSKQLPFRFLSAYKHAENTMLKDAVSVAIDHAIGNLPKFEGQTVVVVDVSGSMKSRLSSESEMEYADIARLFGCAMFKANPYNTMIIGFDHRPYRYNLSSRTPLIDLYSAIPVTGGSTELHTVFEAMANENIPADRIVILSDMQSYNGSSTSSFERYKQKTGFNPSIISIDLAGLGTHQFPEDRITFISGWSEKVFDVIKMLEGGKDQFIKMIESYEIPTKGYLRPNSDSPREEENSSGESE
jgi:hypothetical protein